MTHTAQVVISGYVGTAPRQWNKNSETPVCNFRVGSTRRYFSTKDNQWKSADTTWVQVKAFRSLAQNALHSLSVGDPVIVVGTLTIDSWEKDGVTHNLPTVEAISIGHDLSMGRSAFSKDETASSSSSQTSTTGDSTPSDAQLSQDSEQTMSENPAVEEM
ncbi:single-stranded DNA-binding protein [Alloscardovia criceti]|uniref:single-stranded DNA-binding protein n=1 Tax=Alloscardovia criceti TaxID=356828 RepID=UPI000378E2B3|nr:single-stranded DNA-binding protein [Alloscardovia criceti]